MEALKQFVESFHPRPRKVIRGDELIQQFDSHSARKFRCETHGWIHGIPVLKDGEKYMACEMCINVSPDIAAQEEDGAELEPDPRVPYQEDPYGGA